MIRLRLSLLDMQIRHCLYAARVLFFTAGRGRKANFYFILFIFSLGISRKRKGENASGKSAVLARRSSCARRCADRASSKPWKRARPSLIRQEPRQQELAAWLTLLTLGTTKTTTTTLPTIPVSPTPASLGPPWRKTITCSTVACRR